MSINVDANVQKPIQAPLDAATQNWKDKTKNCTKIIAIQIIALAAIALIGIAALAIAFPVGLPLAPCLGVCVLIFGALSTTISAATLLTGLLFHRNYGNPKTAQKIVDQLKTGKLLELCDGNGGVEYLVKYGFTSKEHGDSIKGMITRYGVLTRKEFNLNRAQSNDYEEKQEVIREILALDEEWNDYRNEHIVPDLPSPLTTLKA